MIHDEPVPLGIRQSVSGPPLPPEPECNLEFKLNTGERYGWWVENDREEERRQCATVHGAVNYFRTQILLDTGATVSMISLDLARRLKIKLNSQKRIKVSGLGGVPSYITSSAQIKITLGWRVVYVMDVWVTNIGEEVDVHLGMDFMFSAGVRLGICEGMVGLPDEESILIIETFRSAPFEDCICDMENMQMWPSDMDNVTRSKMSYGQDEVIGGSPKLSMAHWAVAIKVVNVSDRDCWIEPRTPVARIAEYGNIPIVGQFVRPGLRRYMEWQQIIQENTVSAKARMRQEVYEQMLQDAAPPAVMVPKYKWPTKLLARPREPERAQVTKIVEELPLQRDVDDVGLAEDVTLEAYTPSVIGSLMTVEAPPEFGTLDADIQDGGGVVDSGP
ncbi:hypothetical protein PHMEG_00040153, partial [Phytophthora megakarya]